MALRVCNSSPHVSHDVEWKSLNYAFRYDAYKEDKTLQFTRAQFLDPIYLYIHDMNFDILRARNSFPQLDSIYDVEWRSLNHAFEYDGIL